MTKGNNGSAEKRISIQDNVAGWNLDEIVREHLREEKEKQQQETKEKRLEKRSEGVDEDNNAVKQSSPRPTSKPFHGATDPRLFSIDTVSGYGSDVYRVTGLKNKLYGAFFVDVNVHPSSYRTYVDHVEEAKIAVRRGMFRPASAPLIWTLAETMYRHGGTPFASRIEEFVGKLRENFFAPSSDKSFHTLTWIQWGSKGVNDTIVHDIHLPTSTALKNLNITGKSGEVKTFHDQERKDSAKRYFDAVFYSDNSLSCYRETFEWFSGRTLDIQRRHFPKSKDGVYDPAEQYVAGFRTYDPQRGILGVTSKPINVEAPALEVIVTQI